MLSKIVSGGQTGADRAALDAAIRLGIPHGGWVPKGRLAEDGPIPKRYHVRETGSPAYPQRTERNVRDSDGTLLITRGTPTGGSEYTHQMARRHGRPVLHVDLNRTPAFQAALKVSSWIADHSIRILNVAGPRASKDPDIYRDTLGLIEAVYFLTLPRDDAAKRPQPEPELPRRVRDVVDLLCRELPLKDRVRIANLSYPELRSLQPTLGEYIIRRYALGAGNTSLERSCRFTAKRPLANEAAAAAVVIEALWGRLRESHPLRRVK